MPITNTTTDYTGRTVDMYISGSLNPLLSDKQEVIYEFGQHTKYVAGVQKLIQRYLISLINSGFIEQLLGSTSGNIQAARNLFNTMNWEVIKTFRAYQSTNLTDPDDEQLSTVQLNDVTSNGDTISFSLQLITNAGTDVAFILPLPLS
jgi:hypothetical protein